MIPAIIGALILLTYSLRLLNPYRPQWTKPFLREAKAESNELDDACRYHFAWSTYSLLAVASIGLIMQSSSVYFPVVVATQSLFPSLAWVGHFSACCTTSLTRLGDCYRYYCASATKDGLDIFAIPVRRNFTRGASNNQF